jgi:nucleoside-diphosphate-sugar epimerase
MIINDSDRVLVTGANGFLGSKVVETLLARGFTNVCCFVRPSSNLTSLQRVLESFPAARVEFVSGNLLSLAHCHRAVKGASIIFHVAAGIEKTFPGCFMNSAVTTRNLLEAAAQEPTLKRFVNVSSLAVYSNARRRRRELLDERCELETAFMRRFDAYCFGKAKQDEIVKEYGTTRRVPYVIVRPGPLYGPGARASIHSRVGIDTFGIFLHLGGSNRLPLSYIDNCGDAIVVAGTTPGLEGEEFNVVDDDPPSSRQFLRQYKKHVKPFRSIYVPYRLFYAFCWLWERYAHWSNNQLPPAFNRLKCAAEWQGNRYSNAKLKALTAWTPRVSTREGLRRHFEYFRGLEKTHA